jgi:hypothetical protein
MALGSSSVKFAVDLSQLKTLDEHGVSAIFHVNGGTDSNNSPLPIPDHRGQ